VKFRYLTSAFGTLRSSVLSSLALGSLGLIIFWGCGYWIRSLSQPESRPATLPQAESIQVYFNHDQSVSFSEPYRQKTRSGTDLAAKLITAIGLAQSQIDIAVQEFQLPNIAQALAAKSQAGIKVRLILEDNYSRPQSELMAAEIEQFTPREQAHYQQFQQLVDIDRDGTLSLAEINQRDALIVLRNAGITILDDTADGSRGSGLMHHKFMVVDRRQVLVTSANWTMSDIYGDFTHPASEGNQNNLVQIESTELAAAFTTEFDLMWGDGTPGNQISQFKTRKPARPLVEVLVGETRVSVQFSPTSKQQAWADSSNGSIATLLSSSQQQVDFALFVFSEPGLGDILQAQAQKGVKVRGTIDRQFAYREYSSALPLMGVNPNNLCQTAVSNVQPLSTIGVPTLPIGDLLHHKFAVIDRQTVITGSHNWSNAANYHNDETLLIIKDNPIVAAHFDREFNRLYAQTVVGLPAQLISKAC
jgi:phosphatidylserine/phosphatidylglycerophosphate/cardiolipin synthase-like enzyme